MKVALYARVSTPDQHPEKQIGECKEYATSRGLEIADEDIYIEKLSGYKQDITRPMYEEVIEKVRSGKVRGVVVWALDRWVRNRDTLLEDVTIIKNYGGNIYSVKEAWLEAINIPGALGKTIHDFLLGLIGSLAEIESQHRSDRVRMAYANRSGRWGRRELPERVTREVIDYRAIGKSIRWIAQNVHYYDKNKNERGLSIGTVHKIISQKAAQMNT